jgi:hypothetical protein
VVRRHVAKASVNVVCEFVTRVSPRLTYNSRTGLRTNGNTQANEVGKPVQHTVKTPMLYSWARGRCTKSVYVSYAVRTWTSLTGLVAPRQLLYIGMRRQQLTAFNSHRTFTYEYLQGWTEVLCCRTANEAFSICRVTISLIYTHTFRYSSLGL